MNNVICVLGMHRSGTSLTARWLSEIGVNMGDRLMAGGVGNEDGHFEDIDFCNLHEEIFRVNNIEYGGFIDHKISLNEYHIRKLEYLVYFKNSLYEQWGWKDPRTCIFVENYHNLARKDAINIKYLILFREYDIVVDSLIRRDLKNLELDIRNLRYIDRIKFRILKEKSFMQSIEAKADAYLSAWNFYNDQILTLLNTIDSSDYVLCHYQDFVQNSDIIYETLKKWGFELRTQFSMNQLYDPRKISKEVKGLSNKIYNNALIKESEAIMNNLMSKSNLCSNITYTLS